MTRRIELEILNCIYGWALLIANLAVSAACSIKTRQSYLLLRHPRKSKSNFDLNLKEVKNEIPMATQE